MDLEDLQKEVQAYLAAHPDTQPVFAKKIGVSHSWLNKFIKGHENNPRVKRFKQLVSWVRSDKAARGLTKPVHDPVSAEAPR